MSVRFFPCDHCGATICDHGRYYSCQDICERKWCSKTCAEKEGYKAKISDANDSNDYDCKFCRKEDARDEELFKFLLKHVKLTRKQVLKMYLEDKK